MLGRSVILIMMAYKTNQYSMLILSPATEIVKGADLGIKAATQLQKWQQKTSRGMNDRSHWGYLGKVDETKMFIELLEANICQTWQSILRSCRHQG